MNGINLNYAIKIIKIIANSYLYNWRVCWMVHTIVKSEDKSKVQKVLTKQ